MSWLKTQMKGLFAGKSVLVIGSAPGGLTFAQESYDVVLKVNGAASKSIGVEGKTGLFIDNTIFVQGRQESLRTVLVEAANQTEFQIISSSNPLRVSKELLRKLPSVILLGLGASQNVLRKTVRSSFMPSFPLGMPSTGVRAVVTAFHFGAKSVEIAGFKLLVNSSADGSAYFYDLHEESGQMRPRNHSASDLLCLSSLAISGKNISSCDLQISCALSQWQMEPSWQNVRGLRKLALRALYRGG